MELSQSERARLVVRWIATEKGVNQKDIGEMLGYPNNTYFSNLLSGRKTISQTLLEKIAALDSRINIDFLTGISDEMILGEGTPEVQRKEPAPTPRIGIFVPPELAQMVTDLTSTIKEQQATVREQQAMIRTLIDEWKKERESK